MAVAEFCSYFGKIVRQGVANGGKIPDGEIVAQKSRFFNHIIIYSFGTE
jgi:hypothetical protein